MKRARTVLVLALLLLLTVGIQSSAYVFLTSAKWQTMPVTYDKHTLSGSWQTAVWCGAFNWNDVSPSPFAWAAGDSGDNDVYLISIDGPYNVLAQATCTPSGGAIVRMSIQFDRDETWYTEGGIPAGNQLDAIGVATHELGHGLGLDHTQTSNCGANPATMCALYSYGVTYWRSLEQDDRNGLNAKYP
jgi:hypothetical protein